MSILIITLLCCIAFMFAQRYEIGKLQDQRNDWEAAAITWMRSNDMYRRRAQAAEHDLHLLRTERQHDES